jgi:eukaryotic-like serine/threonine-protein kinase
VTSPPSVLAAALAGRYDVQRELGHGGMATVYLARDTKHGRFVAIKVLNPDLARAVDAARFLREINIAAQLQSPHVLPMLDSGEAEDPHDNASRGLLYYVMPYVDGDSLRGRLAREGALPPSEAMRLLRDVVEGVAHAHRHGVVHRDIKPDNVMLAERHALLMDFGVAKALSAAGGERAGSVSDPGPTTLTSLGISLGTPAYMAPEQAAADPDIDHRADIYSIGVLAYEMLSGRPPFTGAPQAVLLAQITTPPAPLLDVKPDVPPAIVQIVMRCLEKEPARRFQTADELLLAIGALVTPAGAPVAATAHVRSRRLLWAAGLAAAALAVALVTVRWRRDRWLHQTAVPNLARLVDAGELDSAYHLALRIREVASGDSTLNALWARFTRKVVIRSEPSGARVFRASLADTTQWHLLGTTPTDSLGLPNKVGLFRFEKPGYRTAYNLFYPGAWLVDEGYAPPMGLVLDSAMAPRSEMARIRGGLTRAFLVGSDAATPLVLGDFQMDRFEVSNSEYKGFVDSGGYTNHALWVHPFVDIDGRPLSHGAAMARFVDRTGRPGPATWEGGTFPAGAANLPVGGLSWYEAAAYSKFTRKDLPTVYHWARAASAFYAPFVVPFSNLEGSGPLPVGAPRGISVSGVSDLAGNVREWCLNDAGRGDRFILGGGWSDGKYAFVDAYAQPPMDRSAINGIRLVRYDAADTIIASASRPIPRVFTDYTKVAPEPDVVFAGYSRQFDYDSLPLNAKVEERDSSAQDWIREKVTFAAAYGGERMAAWIYLPRHGTPPFQATVVFPGSDVIRAAAYAGSLPRVVSFIPVAGRVVVYPIYKGTHERSDTLSTDLPDHSIMWRDHVVMWVKDFRRTLDYLSTRADIDSAKFSYFGESWGANMGGIIPAVEPRVRTAVLYVAGLTMERSRPEVDPVNFLPRIRIPVLMLNGKYDYYYPSETSQKPFFTFLGTPPDDKRWIMYDGGHDVPRTQLIRESLGWLDRYLGPVR